MLSTHFLYLTRSRFGILAFFLSFLCATNTLAAPTSPVAQVISTNGPVEYSPPGTNWAPAKVGLNLAANDQLRTLALGRATLHFLNYGNVQVNQNSYLRIKAPTGGKGLISTIKGAIYVFFRGDSGDLEVEVPHALGATRGTDFAVFVESENGPSTIMVFDGSLELTNQFGAETVNAGELGLVQQGQKPQKAKILAQNVIQWWLFYPAILDPDDLPLTQAEQTALASSLSAYRSGDLVTALQTYPQGRTPQTTAARIYQASLLLSIGQVDQAGVQLRGMSADLATALQEMIASVVHTNFVGKSSPGTATEWMARSYYHQSTNNLRAALASAREAVKASPKFGFGWARVAELEFSFGRNREADAALRTALALSPRNAQALATRGFVFASQNRNREALEGFEQAVTLDPESGNAWLGRGLMKIRTGDREAGRRDIQAAAAIEPNRSLLRSYLGKAFAHTHQAPRATKEFGYARELDKNDPTPWLYSALHKYEQRRINEAIDHLERSIALNDNRAIYRSGLLLDQDRAVRSASLASIYRSAGMVDVSVREAARGVAYDYASFSSHLFLANSFDALRDPTRFNLRYETVWFNELLLANLLAPAGVGVFSQNISQQEYSRFFESRRLGIASTTDLRSDGQYREVASQYGAFGKFSYSLDLDFQRNEGIRPNNELTRLEWYTTIKHELTPQDTVLFLTKYQDFHSGDNFQYFSPTNARPGFEFDEYQHPLLALGFHHEWSPGVHTLLFGGRLINDQRFKDREVELPAIVPPSVFVTPFDVTYRSEFETYTAELNQIFQTERNTLVAGTRYQKGEFKSEALLEATALPIFFPTPAASGVFRDDLERISVYGYDTWEVIDNLRFTVGLSYDNIRHPENFRQPPLSDTDEEQKTRINPKAAVVWNPIQPVTFRGIYSRSIGGVSFDESFTLEPTQLAGFVQGFRTIIPESVIGSVSAPEFQVIGGAMDVKFRTRTYFGIQGEVLDSKVDRTLGAFRFPGGFPFAVSELGQDLEYHEDAITVTVNQLLGDEWSVGSRYRFTHSRFMTTLELTPDATVTKADLNEVAPYILFNHPTGFFARADARWYSQRNRPLPGDDFWQFDFFVGYRLPRLHGEISIGVMNINDQDYQLNPLTIYAELPRERVVAGRVRLVF